MLTETSNKATLILLWNTYTLYYKLVFRCSIWFGSNWLFKQVLKRKLKKKYDVEISFLEGMPLKLHAFMGTKAKKIYWVHCDLFNYLYEKKMFLKNEEVDAYNKKDEIICVSNNTKLSFEKRFKKCNTKITTIYNPIDIKKNKIFKIVTVGRLSNVKKQDRIIRLAARFKEENIPDQFQIIGDGEQKEELFKLATDLNVLDSVLFLGFINNPLPYIKNPHLMLHVSDFQDFCLAICEAMALKTPVVSTKTIGTKEILENDKYGMLCDFNDESIYTSVKKMMFDIELQKHYEQQGYKRVLEFSVDNALYQFDQLIN